MNVATTCLTLICALGPASAQDLTHFAFLPGEDHPVRFVFRGAAFELRSTSAAGGERSLGRGEFAGGDIPAAIGLEELTAETCLLMAHRTPSSGNSLQIGLLRRVSDAWQLEATATVNRIRSPSESGIQGDWFVEAKLVAWDEAAATATVAFLCTGGAIIESRVPLTTIGALPRARHPLPDGKPVCVGMPPFGSSMRTHRRGGTCLLTTLVDDVKGTRIDDRPALQLNAWIRAENGEWRALQVPAMAMNVVNRDYAIASAADGTVVVSMLSTASHGRVLRSARWHPGQSERGFVVEDTVLTQPPASEQLVLWQATRDGHAAWLSIGGHAARVR